MVYAVPIPRAQCSNSDCVVLATTLTQHIHYCQQRRICFIQDGLATIQSHLHDDYNGRFVLPAYVSCGMGYAAT